MKVKVKRSYWLLVPLWSLKKIYRILLLTFIGALFVGLIVFYFYMRSLPTLFLWHTTLLENEFTSKSDVKTFEQYLALEDTLFTELDKKIYDEILPSEQNHINRYSPKSISNPKRWKQNWNRSFEMPIHNGRVAKGAVLLIHGMSDSPYSLHTQAEYLHAQGFWVLGLRMPGHGTIPSGLRNVKWQDMAAVVTLGMKHLEEKVGSKPIHIMGYSTGAPLALNYTLKAMKESSTLRLPSGLIFYSPAIGVSKAAPLAVWQSRIGFLFGLPKLEWNALIPEFDPFKYGSFAVNAGDQVYRLSKEVQEQFDDLEKHPSKKAFPPVLSFSSIVDTTVSVPAVIENLFNRLPKGEHTLVFFDINHHFNKNHLIKKRVSTNLQQLRETPLKENYTFELISDMHGSLAQVQNHTLIQTLPYQWPKGLYSLSHLAMPISPNDPLYGNEDAPKSPGIQLGHLAIYGETGVLQTSATSLLRQRWNPFHGYIKGRVLGFIEVK